jgi:uncharacterized protein (DUF1015 family)
MADIQPFQGIVYNRARIGDLSRVMTPPYDVISTEQQQGFLQRHPYNMIHLILNPHQPTDDAHRNRYTRAADHFNSWLEQGVLVRDPQPALYLTAITYPRADRQIIRWGLIARVRLEPFASGIVLPHEKTFSKIRTDRFELMKACHANFSPIFALFTDGGARLLDALRLAAQADAPVMDFQDDDGHRQQLWRLTEPDIVARARHTFVDRRIYIADGHHRYETALAYRDWLRACQPDLPADHPANFTMMYLSSLEDPGVTILPAHRLLMDVPALARSQLYAQAERFFDVERRRWNDQPRHAVREQIDAALTAAGWQTVMAVLPWQEAGTYALLRLRAGVMDQHYGQELPAALRQLDVTALNRIIFQELMGFDGERQDNERLIAYASTTEKALAAAEAGACDIAFMLNPTRIEQVQQIAEQGLIMPRKSTYFYPKVITGQVMHDLRR